MSLWCISSNREFSNIIKNTPDNVGPGSYETTLTIGSKKRSKVPFGARTDRVIFEKPKFEPPPVGEYNVTLKPSISITSVFHSNSPRKFFSKSDSPSPDSYIGHADWGKFNKKESHPRPKPSKRPLSAFIGQNVEGYAPNLEGEWVPIKKTKKSEEWVGPGSYSPKKIEKNVHTVPIGTYSERSSIGRSDDNPGPGSYTPKVPTKRLKTSISRLERESMDDSKNSNFTSMGQCEWNVVKKESAAFRSRSERNIFPKTSAMPDPTTYTQKVRIAHDKKNIDTCFGARSDRVVFTSNEVPGPGAYDIPEKWVTKHKSSLSRSVTHEYTVNLDTPGPCAYQPAKKINKVQNPSSSFASKTNRSKTTTANTPGPGEYNPVLPGESEKIPILIKDICGADSWIDTSKIETPDPTAYQTLTTNIKPIYISPTERFSDKHVTGPGPGSYGVEHSSFIIRTHNKRIPKTSSDF